MADPPEDIVRALERAGAAAEAAVAMVERYPEEYRVPILESLLWAAGGAGSATRKLAITRDSSDSAEAVVEDGGENPADGLAAAAAAASVDPAHLERVVHLGDDGSLKLLIRVDGRSKAARATRAAVMYCYIKEHCFDQRDVGIEELRRVCEEQKAYDAPNFARSLRDSPWLFVIGNPRSKTRMYRLSSAGEEQAKTILQELLDA